MNAKQARIVNEFTNIKSKLLTTNVNVWFNKKCVFFTKLFLIM
jgi:hypothetical protein